MVTVIAVLCQSKRSHRLNMVAISHQRYMAIIMSGRSTCSLKSLSQAFLNSGPRASTSSSVGRNLPSVSINQPAKRNRAVPNVQRTYDHP